MIVCLARDNDVLSSADIFFPFSVVFSSSCAFLSPSWYLAAAYFLFFFCHVCMAIWKTSEQTKYIVNIIFIFLFFLFPLTLGINILSLFLVQRVRKTKTNLDEVFLSFITRGERASLQKQKECEASRRKTRKSGFQMQVYIILYKRSREEISETGFRVAGPLSRVDADLSPRYVDSRAMASCCPFCFHCWFSADSSILRFFVVSSSASCC